MPRSPHVLIVDDDREIRRLVSRFLSENGLRASAVADAAEADRALAAEAIDLIVLDLMLPGEDGLSYARRLRQSRAVPILMLTARGEDTDRIVGLEVGADDYVAKPFNPRELLARIRAILRRSGEGAARPAKARQYAFAGWRLDPVRRELRRADGTLVPMTDTEFDLLTVFAEQPHHGDVDRAVEGLCDTPAQPELIKTVRNGGYVFTPAVEATPP